MVRTKYIAAAAVLTVAVLAVSSVIVIGGSADFEYTCGDDGSITVTDRSSGLFNGVSWDVRDYSGNDLTPSVADTGASPESVSWASDGPNVFRVTMTAYTYAGIGRKVTKDVVMEGERAHALKPFGDTGPTVEFAVHTSDFLRYKNERINRAPGDSANTDLVRKFVGTTSTSNNAFEKIVDQLVSVIPNGSDESYINGIMRFVQSLNYVSDKASTGSSEYWKFPVEMLFANAGDCEDLSMLMMALSMAFFAKKGIDVSAALVLFWDDGHAMAAVSLGVPPSPVSDPQDTSNGWYTVNGRTYYTCETTSTGWRVGEIDPSLREVRPDHLIVV